MRLRRRTTIPPGFEPGSLRFAGATQPAEGYEHLDAEWLAVLRALALHNVDHVVIGDVAAAMHGWRDAAGPVTVVPAPYGRNLDRLAGALAWLRAEVRAPSPVPGPPQHAPGPAELRQPRRWSVSSQDGQLDIEIAPPGCGGYAELLLESPSVDLEPGLRVQVASLEDLLRIESAREYPTPLLAGLRELFAEEASEQPTGVLTS